MDNTELIEKANFPKSNALIDMLNEARKDQEQFIIKNILQIINSNNTDFIKVIKIEKFTRGLETSVVIHGASS